MPARFFIKAGIIINVIRRLMFLSFSQISYRYLVQNSEHLALRLIQNRSEGAIAPARLVAGQAAGKADRPVKKFDNLAQRYRVSAGG